MCPARPLLHIGQMSARFSGEGGLAGAAEVAGLTAATDVPAAGVWVPGVSPDAGTRGRVAGCVPEVLPATHAPSVQVMCRCTSLDFRL